MTSLAINLNIKFSGDVNGEETHILQQICDALANHVKNVGLTSDDSEVCTTTIEATLPHSNPMAGPLGCSVHLIV